MKHVELEETAGITSAVRAEDLPAGERILWQGRPDWWRLAIKAFRLRWIAGYFAVITLWRLGSVHNDTGSWPMAFAHASTLVVLFALASLILLTMAALYARTTGFVITDRRIVMRYGVALPSQLNIPLKDVEAAGLRLYGDGTGDIPLVLPKKARPFYFQVWPFARPFRYRAAEPMLRAIPDAEEVARLLSSALASTGGRATFERRTEDAPSEGRGAVAA